MIEYSLLQPKEIEELSAYSVSVGNIPFVKDQCSASIMRERGKIIGFAAVQAAVHTAGSWIEQQMRFKGHSYTLRAMLEADMKRKGVNVYFSIPNNDFEKYLFAKYGPVTDSVVQIKELS